MERFLEALRQVGISPDSVRPGQDSGDLARESQVSVSVAAAAFVPSFEQATLSGGYDGAKYALNPDFFASQETAEWIANKYGTGELVALKVGGEAAGVFGADKDQLNFRTHDGRLINAGYIAAFYARNPEDRFPGVADSLIRNLLASGQ